MNRLRWARPLLVQVARTALAVLAVTVLAIYGFVLAGCSAHVVTSASMEPALEVGDVLLSRPADEDLQVGEIVVVQAPGPGVQQVSHRVLEVRPDGYVVTMGDAGTGADVAVPQEWVQGEALARIPWIGVPSVWLHQGNWLALVPAAALLTLITWGATRALVARRQLPSSPSP